MVARAAGGSGQALASPTTRLASEAAKANWACWRAWTKAFMGFSINQVETSLTQDEKHTIPRPVGSHWWIRCRGIESPRRQGKIGPALPKESPCPPI
ncbi:hypothetical protein GCM10023095_27150 [Pseudaeromonas paramecii]|uniref:Uncharacterized protein n=1 Tax=Pseudaeromonas paramecii TaxID=2138166 RepID=A0ABP8QH20_9GAMM